ncbi:MAG: RibD family protein, partial [Culicoidibacterales bacterium]
PMTKLSPTAKLQLHFSTPIEKSIMGIIDPVFETIYQENLFFTERDQMRPVVYGSFVTSIDGRIAFPDDAKGPLIAKLNHADSLGAELDWWLLNALRASCDGLIFGVNTLIQEPELTGHIYDSHLQTIRLNQGQPLIPWNIIVTRDHTHVPWHHKLFQIHQIPVIILTTVAQFEACCQNLQAQGHDVVGLDEGMKLQQGHTYVSTCLDLGLSAALALLKACGLNKVLVESPTLCHALIQAQKLDELFMTQSGVYIGGDALTIGQKQVAFTSKNHPYTQLLSVHQHEASFLYFRYRLHYDR